VLNLLSPGRAACALALAAGAVLAQPAPPVAAASAVPQARAASAVAAVPAAAPDPAAAALNLPYSAAVAARFPPPAAHYGVAVLAPGAQVFTANADLAAQVAAVVASVASAPAGTHIQRLVPGRSQDGTAIEALHFSRTIAPGTGTGTGTGSARRPAVLLIGQQHGDEPAGAEALLVIARALASGDLAPLLARIDVTVLPRANPDGAERQRRVSANGIDINRDHLLLRTPEAQAVAALVRSHRPVVVVDAHEHTVVGRYLEKFNAVQRYDLLLQYAMTANLPESLGRASEAWFRQPIIAALAADGLSTEWYYTNPTAPGDLRLAMGGVQPDTGRNVNGLRNAVSLLLESRGVGIGHLHLARRVHSQVLALRTVLQQAAAHADELLALQDRADAEVAAAACGGRAVVQAQGTPGRRELLMLDPVTGADKPVDVAWESALALRVLTERARPCGYWLAADQGAAVASLAALGLRVQRFAEATPLQAEAWIETARGEVRRPDVRGTVADGLRTLLQLVVSLRAEPLQAPAGSFYLPLNQPLANLAIAALEPDTQNSYVANRLIDRLDAVRRVMVVPAARLAPVQLEMQTPVLKPVPTPVPTPVPALGG